MISYNTKIQVKNERFFRKLGYPSDYDPPEHVEELMDWAIDWFANNAQPWGHFYEVQVKVAPDGLFFDNTIINSSKLLKRYKKYNVGKAIIIASTAGQEVDDKVSQLWAEDITDQSFFLDAYASAYVEEMVGNGADIIKEWAYKKGLKAMSRFSPGYPGWDLTDQQTIFKVIQNKNEIVIPIQVMESSLLLPKKSQFSIMGLYQGEEIRAIDIVCMKCSLLNCRCTE